jgi:prepilin-type N-terminal cleavage/methylation domain-containing protein/prepilin-type processing-associated H-X9-DG protein
MRKGFTLIELLVVIAIIAILAAILFPVFARAKAKANQNNCLSNVKEIQLALIMYASDNSQGYPEQASQVWAAGANFWPTFVAPYIKNTQLWICPSDSVVGGVIGLNTNEGGTLVYQSSYGANNYIFYGGQGNPTQCNLMIPDTEPLIQYPSEMLGISDAVSAFISTGYNCEWEHPTGFSAMQLSITSDGTANTARHNLGCNTSFMDGHAKWMPFVNFPDPTNQTAGASFNGTIIRHFWYGID